MSRATYLYCLARRPEAPELAGAPPGVPGASAPRLLDLGGGLWLVAADVPLPEYGEEEIARRLEDLAWVSERALAHEAMVEHFAGAEALVPMKLFTLFASDERAAAHVAGELPRLRTVLDRVAGQEEWGVRVRLVPARAGAEAGAESPEPAASGRDFLARKQRQRDAARRAPEAARAAAGEAFAELAAGATAARRREPEPGTPLVLDAAFLVPRHERGAFEQTVAAAARRLVGAACELTLTGPWPPYNFIGDER
jgi:hypothetical protein